VALAGLARRHRVEERIEGAGQVPTSLRDTEALQAERADRVTADELVDLWVGARLLAGREQHSQASEWMEAKPSLLGFSENDTA